MSELRSCPFCGGEADISDEGIWTEPDRFWAYCTNPACFVEGTSAYQTEVEAIEAWNTRAERTCHRVDVNGYSFRFECSLCGYVSIVQNCETRLDELPNYCPNCGAKVMN